MKIVISLLILGTLALVIKKFGGETKTTKALDNKVKEKASELVTMTQSETPAQSTPEPVPNPTPEPAVDVTKKDTVQETQPTTNNDPVEAAYQAINGANANDIAAPSQGLESIELPERLKHILEVLKLKLKFQKAKEDATHESKLESADDDGSENDTDNDAENDDNNDDTNTEEENNYSDNENYGGGYGGYMDGAYPFPTNPATIVAATPVTSVTPIKTPIQLSPIKTNIAANVANHLATMFNGVHLPPIPATPTPAPVINGGAPSIHVNVKGNQSTARVANTNTGARRANHYNHTAWKRH